MSPNMFIGKPGLFWDVLGAVRLEWQVEVAKCLLPVWVYGQSGVEGDFRQTFKQASREEVERAVAQFNPA